MNNKTRWFVLCLAFAMVTLTSCSASPPDDEVLIEKFTSNRNEFQKLVEMMQKDVENTAVHEVDKRYIIYNDNQEGEIDEERFQGYREQLDKMGLWSITEYSYDESYSLVAYAKGWSPEGGVYKGYKYFVHGFPERLRSSLVEKLEYDPKKYEPGTSLYRRIDENWYLWLLY